MNTHRCLRLDLFRCLFALLLGASIGGRPAPAKAAPPAQISTGAAQISASGTQISAGWNHICALNSDGSIVCWGNNDYGQTTLPSPNSGFTQISAGRNHTCGLKSDGSIACWGDNQAGQVTLPSPNSGFTQISAGGLHTCALKSDGSIACWGDNQAGQSTPPTPNSGFTQVTAGFVHTCALKSGGSIACWGYNLYGQTTLPTPNSGFTQVSTGVFHTCVVKNDGAIACWGSNSYGEATPPTPNSGFAQVSAGSHHTCALKSDGSIACWGNNDHGQTTPPGFNSGFTQVSAGFQKTCALNNDGSFICWGSNAYNQSPTISLAPALPASTGYGDSFTQALTAASGVAGGPYTFAVAAGSLPPGLVLASDGTFTGAPTQVGHYSFTLRAMDAIRYSGTQAYTLDITRAPLSITTHYASRVYGDANPSFSASFVGLKNNDPVEASFTTPAGPTSPPGPYPIVLTVTGEAALLDNYSISAANGTLVVGKARLTVKAGDLSRPYGSPNPPLTYAISGFKNGEGPDVVSGPPPLLLTNAAAASRPGAYLILIMGSLTADNYDFSYTPGWLRIEGAQVFLPAALR